MREREIGRKLGSKQGIPGEAGETRKASNLSNLQDQKTVVAQLPLLLLLVATITTTTTTTPVIVQWNLIETAIVSY